MVINSTEHLLGKDIKAEYLNDDKIGRVMDKLDKKGLSSIKWLSRVPLSLGKAKELVNNVLEKELTHKEQQAAERGFGFLKDPLFFADSVFLKSPKRVETMAMLMVLCLLVYSLGQRELRRRLFEAKTGLKNQLGKLTEKPTLRWIFQCFQGIHLLLQSGKKPVVNLTEEKQKILSFFSLSGQNYYILSG